MNIKPPDGLRLPGSDTKFGAGVLGKTSHVALGCVGIWAIIAWRLGDNVESNAFLVGVGILVTMFAGWWTKSSQNFAEKNPAQALLEGGALVDLRRAEMQVKDGYIIDSNPIEINPKVIADHKGDDDA